LAATGQGEVLGELLVRLVDALDGRLAETTSSASRSGQ
jgi:hypothetical protein